MVWHTTTAMPDIDYPPARTRASLQSLLYRATNNNNNNNITTPSPPRYRLASCYQQQQQQQQQRGNGAGLSDGDTNASNADAKAHDEGQDLRRRLTEADVSGMYT